jgi:hypothetical protein
MANEYKDRGLVMVFVVISDGTGDGIINEDDAWELAYNWDMDGNTQHDWYEDLRADDVIVLADVGDNVGCSGGLWDRFTHDCGSDIFCQFSCKVTPQVQVIDQNGVTVDDPCQYYSGTDCGQCGYPETRVKSVLDSILPPAGCGESLP